MKAFEMASEPARLDPRLPIYARVDGRGFSRFTRDMQRPFDPRMTRAMCATASHLVEHSGACAGYVQSDEISLLWVPARAESQAFFGGRVIKMASVLSGMATTAFTRALLQDPDGLASWADRLPHFDARVCQLPDRESAAEMFAWRGADARRNAIQQIARSRYSHRSLQGVGIPQMLDQLRHDGISPSDYPSENLNGTILRRRAAQRRLSDAEWLAIPARHRPDRDLEVLRTDIEAFSAAPPDRIPELTSYIMGAFPALAGD